MIRFPIFHFAGLNPTSTKNFLVQASVTNVSAGVGFAVTVTARDVNNATDTSYTGTVHFTSSDSQATLSAGGTIASGVGTFSATLASRILQTITARDTHYPVINGRSGAISITAAAASHIVLAPSGPIFTTQGTSTHFTITAFDQFNNQATSYRGTVAFSSNDPRALLPPNRPFGAGDNGRVTTLTATLGPVASVTMTATDSVLPATTDTFSVTLLPAAVNKTMLFVAADATASGILLGNGDGTFQTLFPTIPTTGDNIIPADLNNDGRTDASMASATLSSSYAWMGFGDGTFNAPPIVTIANGAAGADASILVCDLDGNGVLDWIIYGPNNMNILTGAGNGSFTSSVTYSTGLSNANIVACDLNNDGKADLLVVSTGVGAAGVMLGNGNGTFQAISTFATAFGAQNLSGLGDINGDGIIDFVVTDGASPWGAQVFLGNGNGTFQALSTFALPTGRTTGVVVDVNGDGVADLVFANYGANNIQVMLGNGDGTFQTGNTYAANTKPMGIIAADLNGDGKMDLALSSWQFTPSPGIIVLMGNGDGTFGLASNVYVISGNPQGMSWGNSMSPPGPLCGFHIACLATPTLNSGFTVTVFALDSGGGPAVNYTGTVQLLSTDTAAVISGQATLTLGRGTFSATLKTLGSVTLTAKDMTVTVLASSKSVSVVASYINSFLVSAPANATVGTAIAYTVTARDQFNATFTGYTGTVAFTSTDGGSTLPANATLTNGVGTFSATFGVAATQVLVATDTVTSSITGTSGNVSVAASAAAKNLDIVVFDKGPHALGVLLGNGNGTFQAEVQKVVTGTTTWYGCGPVADLNGDGKVDAVADVYGANSLGVLLGNGDSTWQAQTNFAAGGQMNDSGGADLNGDGKIDLVAAHYSGHTVSVLLGNGDATFQPPVNYSLATVGDCMAMGDLRGNGIVDLVISGYAANILNVLLGNGNGTFQTRVTYAAGGSTQLFPIVADVNGDGKLDIVVSNYGSGTISVLLNNGDATFKPAVTYAVGNNPAGVFAADVNADGKVDLVVTNFANAINVLLGNGDGTFQARSSFASGSTHPLHPVVVDVNGDGKPDLVVSNEAGSNVSVFLGNGNGTFQAGTNLATGSTPRSLFVLPTKAAIAKLAVIAPATVTHGVGFAYTLTSIDSNANTVPFYAGVVTFTGGGAGATLPPNYQFTNGWRTDRGSHVFTATLTTVGNQIITATDVGYGTLTGKSGTIKVIPAQFVTTHFAVSSLSTTTIGSPLTLSVTALDVNNNTATNYSGTVTFSSNDLGARLPVNTVLANGLGTFSATLYTVMTATLSASDVATATVTGASGGITVSSNMLTFDGFQHNVGTDVESYTLPIGNPWVSVPCMTRPTDLYTMACAAGGANNSIAGVSTFPAPGGTLTNVGQTDVYFSWELPAQSFPGSNNTSLVMKGEKNTSTGGAGCYVFLNSTGTFRFEVNNNGIDTTSAGGGWGNDITNTASFSGAAFQRITAKCITGNGPSGSNTYTIYQDGVHTLPTALTFSPTNPPNDSGTGAHDSPTLNVRSGTLFGINEPNTSTGNNVLIRSVMCNSIAWGTPPFWAVPTTGGFIALPYFTGSPGAETLSMAGSLDGAFFTGIPSCDATAGSGTAFVPATGSGVNSGPTVRDPALFADSRMSSTVRAIVHTSTPFQPGNTSFGVVTSTDGQKWATKTNPNFLAGQTPGGITGLATLWAPNWFLDPNGPVDANGTPRFYDDGTHGSALHVFFVGQTSGGTNTSTIYETHPTAADFSTWSPAVLVGGLPVPAIDPCCVWDGANYFMWIRHVNLDFVVVYKSASLLSGYSLWQSTSWLGLGSGSAEAPQCVKSIDGTKWILHVDTIPGGGSGINYATQAVGTHDWTKDNTGSMTAWSGFNSILVPYTTGPRSGKMCVIK